MTKQQITIEVDVPEGMEATLTTTLIAESSDTGASYIARLQFAPVYQFPTWTSATWLAMDQDGHWSFYQNEPQISDDIWWADGYYLEVNNLLDFTPPPVADWRQSKRRRPGS